MQTLTILTAALTFAAPLPKAEQANPEVISPRQADLLRDSRVQRELGLTAEHRIALLDFFEEWDEAGDSFFFALNPPSGPPLISKELVAEKKKKEVEFLTKQNEKRRIAVAEHLTAAQHGRLKEIERRYLSLFAYQLPDVAAELKLTAEQLKGVRKVVVEYRNTFEEEYNPQKKPSGRSPFELARPYLKTIDGLLSEAQRTRFVALLGAEPKLATTDTVQARATFDDAVRNSPEFFPR